MAHGVYIFKKMHMIKQNFKINFKQINFEFIQCIIQGLRLIDHVQVRYCAKFPNMHTFFLVEKYRLISASMFDKAFFNWFDNENWFFFMYRVLTCKLNLWNFDGFIYFVSFFGTIALTQKYEAYKLKYTFFFNLNALYEFITKFQH